MKYFKILNCDFNTEINGQNHHTNEYELMKSPDKYIVLRRGFSLSLTVNFNEEGFDIENDLILIYLKTGKKPNISKQTYVKMKVKTENSISPYEWSATYLKSTHKSVDIQINIPCNTYIGLWNCKLKANKNNISSKYKCPQDIFLIFNAWCTDDVVYYENEGEREDYLVNDTGYLYLGTQHGYTRKAWLYGQYKSRVLLVIERLLFSSNLTDTQKNDAVQIVRALTHMLNSSDGYGVLRGRWDGDYSDATAPYKWHGSVKILEQFYETNKEVRYGQCWVFCGLLTTVCRALGIPCRALTNFNSAHDTDKTLTVDNYYDKQGHKIEGGPNGNSFDSIWNYHCWVNVWMLRKDIPFGMSGWHAADATPQEHSDGFYQCGPCPVKAIRDGQLGIGFDAFFIYAEVNADIIKWIGDRDDKKSFKPISVDKTYVGKGIVTKRAQVYVEKGESVDENIISLYKNEEQSLHDKIAVARASRSLGLDAADLDDSTKFADLQISSVSCDMIGSPLTISVTLKNVVQAEQKLSLVLNVSSMFYTGVMGEQIYSGTVKITLPAQASKQYRVTLNADQYFEKLLEYCTLSVWAGAYNQTDSAVVAEQIFSIPVPELAIQPVNTVFRMNEEAMFDVSFTNPLNLDITHTQLECESTHMSENFTYDISDVLKAGQIFKHRIKCKFDSRGKTLVVISFSSKQLFDVEGSLEVTVV